MLSKRQEIENLAKAAGLEVEFDPFGPTVVNADAELIVCAPFYPFVGARALNKTVEVIRLHERDELLAKAAAEEKVAGNLRITPGQLEALRQAKLDEGR